MGKKAIICMREVQLWIKEKVTHSLFKNRVGILATTLETPTAKAASPNLSV